MPVVMDDSVDCDNDDDTPTMETLSVSQNTRDNNNNNNNSSLGSRSNSMIPHENDRHPQYRPSPTALAFFQALDQQTEQQQQASSSTSTATMTSLIQKPKASPWIQKQIQTLGWRNRYSQSDDYPLTIETTSTTTTSIKFHVRQVQRGEIDDTYGTGATVWPASMVLIKYLQRHATTKFGHYGTSSQPRTILDLGTGTGITTIAAAVLWGSPQPQQQQPQPHVHIVCTDGDPNVVSLARENVTRAATEIQAQLQNHVDPSPNHHHQIDPTTTDANDRSANRSDGGDDRKTNQTTTTTLDGLPLSSTGTDRQHHVVAAADPDEVILIRQCTIEIQQYWWGTGTIHSKVIPINNDNENEHCQNSLSHCFDMILVSDCVLPKLYPIEPLIEAIDQMLGQRRCDPKPVAVLSYEYRYYPLYDPKQHVTELCAQHQLRLEVVPASEHDPVYSVPNDIEIWHIYRV